MTTFGRQLIELTDDDVIREIYKSQKDINPNIRIEDITRDKYGKSYTANFLGREGYAACMFIDRAWLADHFHTAMLWFKDEGGIKYYPSDPKKKATRKRFRGIRRY